MKDGIKLITKISKEEEEKRKEELSLRVEAIISSRKASEKLNQRMHFLFLFASPLVYKYRDSLSDNSDENSRILDKIDFEKEFSVIESAINSTGSQINYYQTCAMFDKMSSVMTKNPKVLHFSGHGVKNDIKSIGTTAAVRGDEGDFLLFETKKGFAEFASEKMLKDLMKQFKTDIELVFVSSCHSEFIGELFFKAGIDHVICIKEAEEIADNASILFAK